MFVHGGFWHLALNMYTLYLFGPRIERAWTGGEFARYYILCGLGGWFAHLLFAHNAILFGASAAVLGVMLAYAMRWPDDEIYLFGVMPLRVKWTVAMLAAVILVAGMAGTVVAGTDRLTGVAYLAHLGGLAAGWLYLRTSSATSLDRLKQRVSQIPDLPDETPRPIPRLPRSREKVQEVDDIVAKSKAAVARRQASAPPTPSPKLVPKRPDEQRCVLSAGEEHTNRRDAIFSHLGGLCVLPERRAPRTCRGAGAATPFSRRRWPVQSAPAPIRNLRRGTDRVHSRGEELWVYLGRSRV